MLIFTNYNELENNFDKYVSYIENGDNLYIVKNGEPFGIFRPLNDSDTPLTDALIGGVKNLHNYNDEREEHILEKYGYKNN